MEIAEDIETLIERLETATKQLKKAKSKEERAALGNYIYNIYESIGVIAYIPIYTTEKNVFGSHKNYRKFYKKAFIDNDRILKNYFENKPYHQWLIGNIIHEVSEPLDEVVENLYGCNEQISKGEFLEIFNSFLKELRLGKEYDKFIKNVGIYSYDTELKNDCGGYMLYNPINRDTDVFVGNLNYDVSSLCTLVHEFGHVYDFSKFKGDIHEYNKFLHQSFYLEVPSKLFERLLMEYLINNDILANDAKDELIKIKYDSYITLIASYVVSLLDYDMLKKHKQEKYSKEYIYSLIKDSFEETVMYLLDEVGTLDVRDNHIYAYGDIISMFLKDMVDKYGFDNDMMLEMFDRRDEIFSPEFLEKYEVSPEKYFEGYQKELKLLQK